MIGPVQLMLIGFDESRTAAPLKEQVKALKAEPSVRVVDVLYVHKNNDGALETEPLADLLPEDDHEPGSIIDTLLISAEASRTVRQVPGTGRGFLFQGDLLPDFRTGIRQGTGVLALLIEHRWAVPLRDTVTAQGAYPVADGWMGRDGLKKVGLLPQDA